MAQSNERSLVLSASIPLGEEKLLEVGVLSGKWNDIEASECLWVKALPSKLPLTHPPWEAIPTYSKASHTRKMWKAVQ